MFEIKIERAKISFGNWIARFSCVSFFWGKFEFGFDNRPLNNQIIFVGCRCSSHDWRCLSVVGVGGLKMLENLQKFF
ncbi:hypothetical protein [Sodaliphilus pleomorphus]|uniref:hypothetical protein n=1 Tax=Sodaliphilus pleomorphus TaxID=2606626 RepID=UPI00240A482A|nr:hypothetical protein [Sodaliphilus pleomorphus]MDD6687533.1 hypothetical protein [Sodaliphilus pleomorphus]